MERVQDQDPILQIGSAYGTGPGGIGSGNGVLLGDFQEGPGCGGQVFLPAQDRHIQMRDRLDQ